MKDSLIKLRQYLLSGVSFAIPFIACGGILLATGIAINSHYSPNSPSGDFSHAPAFVKLMMSIGDAAFKLMPVVLAGYIANAMAGKPGLVPGMVGGWLATHLGVYVTKAHVIVDTMTPDTTEATAGFLGAMIAGLIAGYTVMLLKKLPVAKFIRPVMPIMVIPIFGSAVVAFVMLKVLGLPIAEVMAHLGNWLESMGNGNAMLLALILGVMIAFDMGGPINKAAFFFGAGLVSEGHYTVMGAVAAAICTPPLGMGLATLINRSLWTEEQREAGIASLTMGMIGITEGAIPFAASDPFRVIPCLCLGSAAASMIAMAGHVRDHAPHGGPIVIFVVDNKLMFVIAIAVGAVLTAMSVNLLKLSTRKPAEIAMEENTSVISAR